MTDVNGAAVVGATVEVVNNSTGLKRDATTTDNGAYTITDLPVGVYTVNVNATGFAAGTSKDVKVTVAFATDVPFTLNPAGAAETVTVTSSDAATQINNNDQQLSTIIENKKIIDLPLLNRDPNALILLAPGTVQTNSALGGFSVNGSRERNNNFLVDGIDNNDTDVPGIPGGLATPNIDATQEFRVITGNFNAEFGRNTGAIITTATKSGSNQYHGNAYIYYRSAKFAARNFFSADKDPLQRKQFGGSIGGPIMKDKLFFFTNYEGDRFNVGVQNLRTVPSAAARTGIIVTPAGTCRGTDALAGNCGTLDLRPSSPNNATGRNLFGDPAFNYRLDPAIQSLLSLYPLGNDHAQDPLPGVFEAFRFSFLERNRQNSSASRVDYRIRENHTLSASYNFNQGNFSSGIDETFPGFGDEVRSPQRGQVLSLTLTSNFGSNIVNEFRFGGNRAKAFFNGPGDGSASNRVGAAVESAFSAAHYDTSNGSFGGVNGSNINLNTSAISSLSNFDTQFRFSGTTVLGDNFTWIKGNHTTKWGFERRWIYSNGADNFSRAESLNFNFPTTFGFPILRNNAGQNVSITGLAGAIQNYASFLYGLVAIQSQSQFFNKNGQRADQDYRGFRGREFDIFGQDTWKVRSNLTLNYGLRWEYKGVPYEVNGQLSTLVNQDPSSIEPAGGFTFQLVGKNSGTSNQLYKSDKNNFGPRVGFAYSPAFNSGFMKRLTGGPTRTSIRGGYGIFYDRVFGNLFGNARGNPPFQEDFQDLPINSTNTGTLSDISRVPTLTASPVVGSNAEIFPVIFALPGNNKFQSKYANPYEQKWNIGFQRELGNQWLIEANYVGAKGTNELRVIDGQLTSIPRCNALAPTVCGGPISTSGGSNLFNGRFNDAFFQVAENLSIGFSTYNAMQLTMTKTLTNKKWGLGQIQGAYTWSHSIDNSADPLVGQSGERTFPRDSSGFAGGASAPERGNSGFDTRHRFVLNYIYEIPLRFDNHNLDRFLGNWEMAGIWTAQSGHPYSIFGGVDSAGSGLSQRASFGNGTNNLSPTPDNLLNPRVQTGPSRSLFTNPTPPAGAAPTFGVQGNVGRGAFVGPDFNKFDLSLIKRFPINESVRFRIQADFFNLFNRVNFGQPVNTINSLNFGQSTSAGDPRIIQFAARFEF